MTGALWRELNQVNDAVNQKVRPGKDSILYGVEDYWPYPIKLRGDCEDYALEKRKILIAQGLPADALLIVTALNDFSIGHAVLAVNTDRGDFILDNLKGEIRHWSQVNYKWLTRQSTYRPYQWVMLQNAPGLLHLKVAAPISDVSADIPWLPKS